MGVSIAFSGKFSISSIILSSIDIRSLFDGLEFRFLVAFKFLSKPSSLTFIGISFPASSIRKKLFQSLAAHS
jgi:hypothetical protein